MHDALVVMPSELQSPPPSLTGVLILHAVVAAVCFVFFTAFPIGAGWLFISQGDDVGGPMFPAIFVVAAILGAAFITVVLEGASLLTGLARRTWRVPLWVPSLLVFTGIAVFFHLFPAVLGMAFRFHFAVPLVAGVVAAVAFLIYWAALSCRWFLPRFLKRCFASS